ncbi:MAG: N-acetylglucosamine-6-phosphate deacetylase [Verrucomicrobia bacterium]|nr:N-acetylglucosamine-6-phosphate deacetylase [Verrucomicrobiota bacterium]
MTTGEIAALHYLTRRPTVVRWKDGIITSVEPASSLESDDVWIAPALVDLQINGYAGVDFQRDDFTGADLLKAARRLRADGCSRFFFTLITNAWPTLLDRLRRARALRAESPELQAAIAGWHMEGPFLSSEPGFCGAHNPAWMINPSLEQVRELRAVAGDDPLLITAAPERPGVVEIIKSAVSMGIKVSLGHTNASFEVLRQAVQSGATGFTHLANGCPRDLDRHDNILWRMFETAGLTVSLIPDRIHVSPALFRLIHRVLKPESIYYTTDAMSAAGAPPGRYRIGQLELEVGADQVVRLPGKPNFAGSALRPIEGVFRAAQMLNCAWQEVWDRLSTRPASLMNLPAGMAVGLPVHLCLLTARENQLLALKVLSPVSRADEELR